jgi:hypothetical protein
MSIPLCFQAIFRSGAQAASLGLAAAILDNTVVIVPRGSTAATAAAADAHDKR